MIELNKNITWKNTGEIIDMVLRILWLILLVFWIYEGHQL